MVMKWLRTLFRRINVKITAYFALAFVVMLAVILLMVNSLYRDRLSEEVSLVAGQKLSLAASRLDRAMSDIRALHFQLMRSPVLQESMERFAKGDEEETLTDILEMKREIARVTGAYASVRSVILIGAGENILDPIYAAEPYAGMLLSDTYDRYIWSKFTSHFSAPSAFPLRIENPDAQNLVTVTYFGAFYDVDDYNRLGTMAINVNRDSLLGESEALLKSTFTGAWIVDDQGGVILGTGDKDLTARDALGSDGAMVELGGKSYARYALNLTGYPQWTVLGLISYESINAPMRSLARTLAVISLVSLITLIGVGYSISRRITMPLSEMSRAMPELGKGNWRRLTIESSSREIDDLLHGYNAMVESLHGLTDEIRREQVEKRRIKVAMIESRLELLQSQINPHFIHNTLNTMRYLAQKEGNSELNELITSFNSLLRASMSVESVMNPLSEELDNLNHYMAIQRKRYDVNLNFVIDAPEDALHVPVPKLLLQPLVENALFHGILPVGAGSIRVVARRADGRLWISIVDDGAGMDDARLRQLLLGEVGNARGYNQVGLKNVNDRLKLYYGTASHLVIDSREGEGTAISFSVGESGARV